ncbi:MAG: PEP-CTERM sorting domain-containing protein [Cytophagaceae bacterium]|nr:MAG: PEP-CTERM sorting domain-containing protein [Cytophagaceae bacterium]
MTVRGHFLGLIALSLIGIALPAHAQTSLVNTTTLSGATGFSDAKINNQGQVIYTAAFGTQGNVYTNQSGANTFVVKESDASPIAGATYSAIDSLDYNLDDSGRITFRSTLTPTASGPSIFRKDSTTTSVVVQKSVTTVSPGTTMNTLGNYDANNSGYTVWSGRQNTATNTAGNWGIWSRTIAGVGTQLVAQNDVAPGLSSSARFNTFAFPSVDNSGNVSFFATVTNDLNAGNGVFTRVANGTVSKIAAGGDTAAGVTNGFFSFFSRVTRNDNNTTAFFGGATVGATELRGIWTGSSSLSLVAINGQTVTTALGTATFGNTYNLGNLNASGTGVFRAASMTGAFTQAVFSFTGANLTPLFAQGDSLFGSTITTLGVPSINDAGTIVFNYTLANGVAGVYSSAAPAVVPESGTVSLFGIGISALGLVIRRKRSVGK